MPASRARNRGEAGEYLALLRGPTLVPLGALEAKAEVAAPPEPAPPTQTCVLPLSWWRGSAAPPARPAPGTFLGTRRGAGPSEVGGTAGAKEHAPSPGQNFPMTPRPAPPLPAASPFGPPACAVMTLNLCLGQVPLPRLHSAPCHSGLGTLPQSWGTRQNCAPCECKSLSEYYPKCCPAIWETEAAGISLPSTLEISVGQWGVVCAWEPK